MQYIDITHPLHHNTPIYPEDTRTISNFPLERLLNIAN